MNQPHLSEIRRIAERLKDCDRLDDILKFLNSGCQPVQELAFARLQTFLAEGNTSSLFRSVLRDSDSNVGLINALAMLHPETWMSEFDPMTLLNRLIRTRRAEAQSAVARLICRQFPEHISLLIEFLNMPFARVLCFHAARGDLTSDAIIKIIRWMLRRNDVRSSSPVLGLLISPRLLASLADIDLALTNDMAATFGFVEVELASPKYKQQLQEFLSHGIYFINNAMLAIPLEEVLCNIAAIQRNMLIASGILVAKSSTQLIDGHHSDESNLEKPMHQGCFFAAIRENEHNELANCPQTNAFKF